MDILDRLENAVGKLLGENELLRAEKQHLLREKNGWDRERRQLVAEIDRMLQRIESFTAEDS